jgi:integrase
MVPLARSADSCAAADRIRAEPMSGSVVLDAAGRRRSPATLPGFHAGYPPRNKGLRYPADPPTVEEIVAVMRIAGDGLHGRRLRGLIVVLWRADLRIDEALALREADLDRRRGSILVRRGKGGRRREIGMDDWGWQELEPWLTARVALPIGPLFCVINGRTRGRPWTTSGARAELRRAAARAGVRRRFAPHQLRPATRSRWPMKASRSSSSNANSGTATSGSPRSISRASTTPRSSRPSTHAAPR